MDAGRDGVVAARRNFALSKSLLFPHVESLLLVAQSSFSPRLAAVMAASTSVVAIEAVARFCASYVVCAG